MELSTAQNLAHDLMRQHGLLSKGWTFEYDNAIQRFGVCKHRQRVIGLSRHLVKLNDLAKVKDTILHEIAHALTPGAHHGYLWKRKCIEIGANPERCYSVDEVNTVKQRYEATCTDCGKTFGRTKKVDSKTPFACPCQKHLPWSMRKKIFFKDTRINLFV